MGAYDFNSGLRIQLYLARAIGTFGLVLILMGYLISVSWLAQSGIICAVLGFILFYVLRF